MYLKLVAITESVFGFKRLEIIQEIQNEFQALNFLQIDLIILEERSGFVLRTRMREWQG